MATEISAPTGLRVADRMKTLGGAIAGLTGWRRYGLAFLSGIGATLAMAPYYIFPLLVVGFSTLFILLDQASLQTAKRPLWRAALTGWFFGFGYFLTGIYWMGFAFLVRAQEFAWMVPIAIPGFAAFLALFFALPSLLYVILREWIITSSRRQRHPYWLANILLLSVCLSLFEYLRGHVMTGLPWNLVGQAAVGYLPLAQSASFYGVYGLSLVLVFLSLLPALDFVAPVRAFRQISWSLLCLAGFVGLLTAGVARLSFGTSLDVTPAQIAIVQPNIAQKDKIDPALAGANFDKLMSLSQRVEKAAPLRQSADASEQRLMLWPENAVAWIDEQPFVLEAINQRVSRDVTIFAGAIRREPASVIGGNDEYFNAMAILQGAQQSSPRAVSSFYDKHHLVPFGEYLPLKGLLKALNLSQLAPVQDGFKPGSGPSVFKIGTLTIAPLICYEAIFPGALYPAGQRPDLMVTSTNDAWFGDGAGPKQHLDQARLRSIESGVPMARSANTGISSLIDGYGRVLEAIDLYKTGVIHAQIPPLAPRTLYDRFGDLSWLALLLLMSAAGVLLGRRA